MNTEIQSFNDLQSTDDKKICDSLMKIIDEHLSATESKIWHAHPVWFLAGNPIVGYSKLKGCIRLMFWSGANFDESDLQPGTGNYKDASIRYTDVDQIDEKDVKRWLKKSKQIQWDYKNIYKHKGKLVRLK